MAGVAVGEIVLAATIIGFTIAISVSYSPPDPDDPFYRRGGIPGGFFIGMLIMASLVCLPSLIGGIFLVFSRKGGLWVSYFGLAVVFLISVYFFTVTGTWDYVILIPVVLSVIMIVLLTDGQRYMRWKKPFIQID